MPLPRLLLLSSEAPHTAAAGAIVFHRLFRDYPADRLLVVTNHLPPANAGRLDCRYAALPLAVDRLDRTRLWPWRATLRVLGGANLIRLLRIDDALDGFTPDIVITLMQDSWFYDLAARYARARQLPFALFIHDLAHGFEPVSSRFQPRQLNRDRAVFQQAAVRFCISQGMVDFFSREFALPAEVLLPPKSNLTPSQSPQLCRTLKRPEGLTLGYAGGLHYGYGEQLLALLPVLRQTRTKVEVFGPTPNGRLEPLLHATDVFSFNGYAPTPEEAWRALLQKCDVVLQPYLNPPGGHELQYRTHFPSKLGDCLTLGLPLLVTGPADASGLSWCSQHPDSALLVPESDPAAIREALERLRRDEALRVRLATGAQSAAPAFDAAMIRTQLLRALSVIARGN